MDAVKAGFAGAVVAGVAVSYYWDDAYVLIAVALGLIYAAVGINMARRFLERWW